MSNQSNNENNWDVHWHALGEGMKNNPGRNLRHDYILKIVEEKELSNILDYGAGDGQLVAKLISNGRKAVGWEHSVVGVEKANEISTKLELEKNVFVTPSDQKNYFEAFDVIIMSEVIEHIEYPDLDLLEVKKLLKANGYFIATVPSGPISYFDRHIGHFRHYSEKSLKELLLKCNFADVNVTSFGFPIVNLVRVLCLLLNKKMPKIVMNSKADSIASRISHIVEKRLFKSSMKSNRMGWQLIAIARKPDNGK